MLLVSDTEAMAELGRIVAQQEVALREMQEHKEILFKLLESLYDTTKRGLVPVKGSKIFEQISEVLELGVNP